MEPGSEKPQYKLYTEKAIAGSTLLGGPLAGAYLISKNFKNLGLIGKSRKWLYYGILGTVVFLWFLIKIPAQISDKIPDQVFQAAIAGLMYYLVVTYQKDYLTSHFEKGGPKASAWGAAGYGILAGILTMLVIVGFGMLQPNMEGNLLTVNDSKHEIFYSDSVSESEAELISDALIEMNFLSDDYPYYLKIEKEYDQFKLLLPVDKSLWNDEETIENLHLVQYLLTEEYLGEEVNIILFEDGFSGREFREL